MRCNFALYRSRFEQLSFFLREATTEPFQSDVIVFESLDVHTRTRFSSVVLIGFSAFHQLNPNACLSLCRNKAVEKDSLNVQLASVIKFICLGARTFVT